MNALTHTQLRTAAPSIFALSPWEGMSARYRMVPTIDVVDVLGGAGFLPVMAAQSRCRIPGKQDFTKHMIRFRQAQHLATAATAEVPEVVLVNSHDGTACYQFMAGVFRMVCSNGMIVQSANLGNVSVRHVGSQDFSSRILDATYEVVSQTPQAFGQIETFKQIQLPPPAQAAFAEAAGSLRDNDQIRPAQLLAPRRSEDRPSADGSRSLWTTLNAVQENMVKGGIRGRNATTGRRTTTRAIKSVDADVKTNKALWMLAERMAQLVS